MGQAAYLVCYLLSKEPVGGIVPRTSDQLGWEFLGLAMHIGKKDVLWWLIEEREEASSRFHRIYQKPLQLCEIVGIC